MITNALLYLLYISIYAITAPLRLFDNVSVNSNIATSISTLSGYISGINSVFPVDTIITILGIFLGYEVIIATYKIIKWVYQKIPTIN